MTRTIFICAAVLAATATGSAAEGTRTTSVGLPDVVLTDAIRIEVASDGINRCAEVFQWAFNLPGEDAGFGPMLPGVPYGFGPRCAVMPSQPPYVSARGE